MRKILIVDDNISDIDLIKEILDQAEYNYEPFEVYNGQDAIDFILKRKPHEDAPDIDIIILDLNLPMKKGTEVLEELRSSNVSIPVIVYTTSDSPSDITEVYKKNANCYIVKPSDTKDLYELLNLLGGFWFKKAQLPRRTM